MADKLANSIQVEKYLSGINYPADKEDIMSHAREKGAGAEVLDMLRRLPETTFRSPTEISKAIENSI